MEAASYDHRLALRAERGFTAVKNCGIGEVEVANEEPSALSLAIRDEWQRALVSALSDLDALHREVVALRFYGNFRLEEIAEALDLPIGTVKSRLFYAVKKIRKNILAMEMA